MKNIAEKEIKNRLTGIDLFRGLATFAVVVLHAGKGVQVVPPVWSQIIDFALFAVPFFLALSFYLSIDKLYSSPQPYPLRSRLARILIPYGVWSAFYLIYRVAKYGMSGEFSKLLDLVLDPLSLICFGGASPPLYFLPLLGIGMVLIKLSELSIEKNISLKRLALLCVASFLSYEMLLISGNGYDIVTHLAFQPLLAATFPIHISNPILRSISVVVACSVRLFPYILVGMILAHPALNKFRLNLDRYPFLWLSVFICLNMFGSQILPQSLYEIIRGYSGLLTAISFSFRLKGNYYIDSLGSCSFGIYLIHFFIIEIFQSIAKRTYPDHIYHINAMMLMVISVAIMVVSWIITSFLMKNKRLSKTLFG
jgi:fucose 4-O-acetylase-like acetyltransferase